MKVSELRQIVGESLQEFKIKAGVYFLCLDGEVVYVGQSVDIGQRVNQHLQRPNSKMFNEILFVEGKDPEERKTRELHYILTCRPKLNTNGFGKGKRWNSD